MAMTSEQFADLLEQYEVMSPADIDSLREQISLANPPMHPHFIARRLVAMGYLNSYFAKNLLAMANPSGQTLSPLPDEDFELEPLEEELSDEFAALEAEGGFQDLELNLPPLEDIDMLGVPAVAPQLRPNVTPLANPQAARKQKERSIPLPLMVAMGAAVLLVIFIVVMIAGSVIFRG